MATDYIKTIFLGIGFSIIETTSLYWKIPKDDKGGNIEMNSYVTYYSHHMDT